MNNLDHFQSVASLTRSLFELWLDLKILAKDQTGEDVRKYNEFPEIERYRAAQRRNGRTNESAPSFAKDDDSTLPKEPNGSKIGLGPKPIWGMSVKIT